MGPRKVVIVDDDRDTREQLQVALEGHGYQVVLAQSGLRLISYLHVDRPDVILLDVVMSWIDGFELCRALKRNPRFASIPVVFISGRSDSGAIEAGLSCGAAAYFPKPIDVDELFSKLDALTEAGSSENLA